MIKYELRDNLSRAESAELANVLRRAADYDAEPEYTTIRFAEVEAAMSQADSAVHHLLIWMLPHATAMAAPNELERIAGLLRLACNPNGVAEARVVIDPGLRSIGIMTLLVEQVGLDTASAGGWMRTGAHTVTAWARGNHPAAGRLSKRFLIPSTRRIWKLIRATTVDGATAAPVLEPISNSALEDLGWATAMVSADRALALREGGRVVGVVTLDLQAVRSEEFGDCATITRAITAPNADVHSRRRMLEGAVAVAHEAGRRGAIIYVDSDDASTVNACRLNGFQHDRTDVCFQIGGR
ncbi:hypothetical protein A5621_13475 [Mycobacterium colombiense]|uniref:hypothetical protein n=1 Tax=Mycobacterium colombiense TaxID=339268 RepID=UPI0007FFAA1D|nr:hypothetical protein [Mycobacterium colombiense]OBJ38365.1 hypothetical protein A5621_13475 [Mycobacterium colombiense]